jgi:hypothetical protein
MDLGIAAQAITEIVGVAVAQGTVTGTLKSALTNEWTLYVATQTIIGTVTKEQLLEH